jgi:two-component system sensor histidine kinase BaeS
MSGPPEFAELGRAFESAAHAIAGTERLRRQVIADVGHELRTPVTNLRAQLEAMQQGLVPADADALQALLVETRLLQRLVEDFEELTLADAGRVKLHLQVLPLRETLADILAPLADAAGARWRVDGPRDRWVTADEERLRQIVANLIENAARHRPVDLQVDVVVHGIDARTASFLFRDNGPGVAAADIPHVFERFYRADRSRSRTTGGSGLGLAITRGLVEAMGGTIRYDGHPGAGAAFVVTLPRAPRPGGATERRSETET